MAKNFLWAGRKLKLKNLDFLREAFALAKQAHPDLSLEVGQWSPEELEEKIKSSYALVLPSVSEVSPNLINSAIRHSQPFILTKETGLSERFKNLALLIDPLSVDNLKDKIIWLANQENYNQKQQELANFSFNHSWGNIANEFIEIYKKI